MPDLHTKAVTYADLLVKRGKEKIVFTTAYASWQAQLADEAGIDGVIVGDSAGHVELGYKATLPVRLPGMLERCVACWRGSKRLFLIGDAPFGSTECSNPQAVETACEFVKHGCSMVKLEGPRYSTISAIADAGILVMAHLGLTPQGRARFGGYKIQGRTAKDASNIVRQCVEAERAGASMLLLEAVPPEVGAAVTSQLSIPVIGVGAGMYVDGQCVIAHDLIGIFSDFKPKFAFRYLEGGRLIREALTQYASDVRSWTFPFQENLYTMLEGERDKFLNPPQKEDVL